MHPDTLERFAREHIQDLLEEAETRRRIPAGSTTLRLRLARWLRALAGRLDHLEPAPVAVAQPEGTC